MVHSPSLGMLVRAGEQTQSTFEKPLSWGEPSKLGRSIGNMLRWKRCKGPMKPTNAPKLKSGVRTGRHPLGAVRVVHRVLQGRDRHAQAILHRTRVMRPARHLTLSLNLKLNLNLQAARVLLRVRTSSGKCLLSMPESQQPQ